MFFPPVLNDIDETTAVLGSGATYTGAAKSCALYKDLIAVAYATTIGGTLYIDQSPDGTNWDFTDSIAVAAATGTRITTATTYPWCRLRYVNGAGIQGVFRCHLHGKTD
jgi:hypothetical protein